MSSLFDNYNPSILAIPAYYVLAVIPHALALNVATQGNLKIWDNRNPRSSDMKSKLKSRLPAAAYAKYERLEACHTNGMENLPLFATAIVLGNLAGLEKDDLSAFVGAYLAIRVAYTGVYITHTTQGPTYLRSGLWLAGVALCFRVLVRAAGALSDRV